MSKSEPKRVTITLTKDGKVKRKVRRDEPAPRTLVKIVNGHAIVIR